MPYNLIIQNVSRHIALDSNYQLIKYTLNHILNTNPIIL